MSVCIVDGDLITAYGSGIDACWNGLLDGRSAVKPLERFSTEPFHCHVAAVFDERTCRPGESIVWQMLSRLLKQNDPRIPPDAAILLASTTGEVDLLEQALDAGESDCSESKLAVLLKKICGRLDGSREGAVVSAACASAAVALAQGAQRIEQGDCDCVAVVACDAVTEFVFSGFASLMALDPDGARPFDADRRGLSVGEAAGFAVLMSTERAERERRTPLGEIAGWGMSNDANHMTGPSRDGTSLAKAIDAAIRRADVAASDIAMICAHGTGTGYNDSMEIKAFKRVFDRPRTVFSVKGGTGHTLGAAGLVEALLTLRALEKQMVPPTVSLQQVDEEARGWVSAETDFYHGATRALSTNSGFGGVNAALLLRRAGS